MDFTPWGLMDITPEASSIPAVVHIGNQKTVAGAPALETSSSGTLFCANCFSVPKGQNGVGLTWAQILAHPGLTNERNPWADADVRPRTDWNQATITLDQNLTNDFFGLGSISAFADGFWSNQRGKQVYPAGNGQARQNYNKNIPLPTINPYYPIGAPAGLVVDFNLALDIPTLIVGGEVANHWDAGLNFDSLPFGWTGKYTFSITDDHNYGDNPNTTNPQNVSAALGNVVKDTTFGSGATLTKPSSVPYLNPFCDSSAFKNCQDPATLAWITAYRLQHERWWIQEQDFNFNGPIYDLPGGPLKVAFAGQYLNEHWSYTSTSNYDTFDTAFVNNGTDAASQSSYALFTQADIPILGQNFTLPFVESLLVELGYRYDKYNNLSDPVWTPKVAVNWLVGDGFTFRGAWGKSFRVPSFAENSPGGSRVAGINPLGGATNATNSAIFLCPAGSASAPAGSATAVLNPNCLKDEAHTQPGGVGVQLAGNGAAALLRGHGLSPQTLYQWSLGFNFTPTQPLLGIDLSGLNVDVSWFHLYFRGLIENNSFGKDDPNNPLSIVEFTFIPNPNLPITDPVNAKFYNLIKALSAVPNRGGFAFDLNFINNIKFIQDTALTNIGKRDFGGIDFDFRYDFDLGKVGLANAGALNLGAAGYYELTDKSRASDATPYDFVYTDKDSGSHLKRVRYRLGWANDTWNATVFANYFGHGQFGNGQNVNGANLVPPCFYAPGSAPGACFPGSPYYGPLPYWPNMTPAVVFWDVSLGYNTGESPNSPYLRNIALQLNVNDIFDKAPPFQVGARGNGAIRAFDNGYPDLQRTFTFTITKTW
jgi:iron complex outermembrane receptor protein